jgi:hypothetical protein
MADARAGELAANAPANWLPGDARGRIAGQVRARAGC